MLLYNSLSHEKEEFVPHTPGHVTMYTCGPTVYHYAHIGNLRTYIMEDILDRYLRYLGYLITFHIFHPDDGLLYSRQLADQLPDADGREAGTQDRHGDREVLHGRILCRL